MSYVGQMHVCIIYINFLHQRKLFPLLYSNMISVENAKTVIQITQGTEA